MDEILKQIGQILDDDGAEMDCWHADAGYVCEIAAGYFGKGVGATLEESMRKALAAYEMDRAAGEMGN